MGDHAVSAERPAQVLAATFGFDAFRPGQEQVVEALLAGRSALAVFPTGAGKSLCYQLPALLLEGMTVVVSPLIALMKDQIDFLQRSGIEAARLDSSLDAAEQREIFERLRAGSLKLLYVAPERFNNERFLAQLARARISLFAVDEAHCISEWGHNFRPDYLKLAERARELAAERVLALTATATPAVVADIRAGFGIQESDVVVTGFYRPNLTLLTTPVTAAERAGLLVDRLRERPPGSTIVYVTLQRTSLDLADLLAREGLPARPYHAGMSAEDRVAVQEWWSRSSDAIVVATIAFGMGIDKADVRYVYHYNLPKSLESYSQEIGRAGRDGRESICELLACPDDVPTLENFAYGDTPTRPSARSSRCRNTSCPGAMTCGRSCSRRSSRTSSSTAYCGRERRSTPATGSVPSATRRWRTCSASSTRHAQASCAVSSRRARQAAHGRRSRPTTQRRHSLRSEAGSLQRSSTSTRRA
jgi:ATP-dependent DNA helicase RecQ